MYKQTLTWSTATRCIGDLVSHKLNPRVASDAFKRTLTRLLKKYGLVEIPAVDLDGTILAGHQRIAILLALHGPSYEIEVRIPNRRLTESERKEYLLASNRAHADWDYALLAEHFDVDLLLAAGFDDTDLGILFDDLTVEDDDFDTDAEIKKIKKTKVKTGDLYQLGEHRIICGDSTDLQVVGRLMGGKKACAILSDPPFNIGLSYNGGIGGKGNYGGTVDDAKSEHEYEQFLRSAMQNGLSACAKDAHIFFYHDPRYTWMLQKLYAELGIANKRTCLWVKNNSTPTPGVAFNRAYEPALYGVVGKPFLSDRATNLTEVMNREIGSGNKTMDDIYDLFDLWLARRVTGGYTHPTEKPPSLHERALRRCTRPGEIVLDLFSGSASLMAACHQLKRTAYLVEREPLFVELALVRYEKLTGNQPRKLN
jgi:DNA modification methylase